MRTVFTSRVFSVEVGAKRFPNGREHEVAIVRHPPAVVVVPLEDDGRVVLIRQFRAAIDRELTKMAGADVEAVSPLDPPQRAAVRRIIDQAFVSGFRFVMLGAAVLALLAAATGAAIR